MGCGVVCGLQPTNNKYIIYAKKHIEELFPFIKISKPFLSEKRYNHFAQTFKQTQDKYILKVTDAIALDETVEESIMEKWKVLLYGADKGDQIYKRCLSFQVRNEKQIVTNEQRTIKNNSSLANTSYHELKRDPQYHQCFKQIEKDLNRTFSFKIEKRQIFQNVLKRISNYFPSMGYTQGVNFIVGYLLVLGYSESDTFWMFIHLAINKRYLILGMYQDGFPLTYIYTLIFKNMLNRKDPELYNHFFNNLILEESMWVFKWFITYYIYSFPFSLIKHIWNLVIQMGGFALVYFALSLILNLRNLLLSINDACDMSEFLQTLKDPITFNKLIKLNSVIEYAYELSAISSDFQGLDSLKPSLYKEYYKIIRQKLKETQKYKNKRQLQESKYFLALNRKQTQVLQDWYGKLLVERMQFQKKEQSQRLTQRSIRIPESMKHQYDDLEKSIQLLQEKVIKNESIKLSNKLIKDNLPNSDYFQDLLYEEPLENVPRPQRETFSPTSQLKHKFSTKISYEMNIQAQINEVQQESDSNDEEILQNLQNMKQEESYINDDITERNPDLDMNISSKYQIKVNTLVGQCHSSKRNNHKQLMEKANNIKPYMEEKKKGFGLVGLNILNNLSIAHSQNSSLSSNNNFKPKKQKQNNIMRLKSIKTKTQQKSQPSIQPSDYQSSIDRQTQQETFSRIVKRNVTNTETQLDYTNVKCSLQTEIEFMNNSHSHRIQELIIENSFNKDKDSETKTQIQIFNGNNLFKKKKKIHFRNSNDISISNDVKEYNKEMSENRNHKLRNLESINQKLKFPDEQSLESILYPLSNRKRSAKKNLTQSHEIESMRTKVNHF